MEITVLDVAERMGEGGAEMAWMLRGEGGRRAEDILGGGEGREDGEML